MPNQHSDNSQHNTNDKQDADGAEYAGANPAADSVNLAKNVLMTREQRIAELSHGACWDMVIIGGGITGAGILKLASQLGLKVLLLEQQDFAWGSSSRSSKMVHGGLRYMAQGQLALTRESVTERQRLLHEGQPLVSKQSFVMSHYKKSFPGPWLFNQLLSCYDFIAGEKQHKFWPKSSYLALAPKVAEHDLLGGTQFFDALTEDARLVQRLIQESLQLGGQALNYAKVSALDVESDVESDAKNEVNAVNNFNAHNNNNNNNKINKKITVHLEEQTQPITINAKLVINACGAWSNLLGTDPQGTDPQGTDTQSTGSHSTGSHSTSSNSTTALEKSSVHMRPLRGSHLVLANWRLPVASVISVRHAQDKRPVQIYPWQNVTIVGTTDIEHHDDMAQEAKISQAEFDYLLATIAQQFSHANITKNDIISTFSGVRPVTTTDASLAPSKEKREHHIETNQGVITVTGGKLTTFRLIAEQVLTLVVQHLDALSSQQAKARTAALNLACQQPILSQCPSQQSPSKPCSSKQSPNSPALSMQNNHAMKPSFSDDIQQQILACYGEFSSLFVDSSDVKHCTPIRYSRHLWAELLWSVKYEQVQHLDDLLLRRTRLGNVLPAGARELLPKIKVLCSPYLSWSEQKWQAEITRYLSLWQRSYSLPCGEVKAEP